MSNGLDSLFGDDLGLLGSEDSDMEATIRSISREKLHSFHNHPFHVIEDESMQELADSINENGIITPLLVRAMKSKPGEYEIVSGHRRNYAAGMLGLEEVPCILRELSDAEAVERMVDSNINRPEILPSEKAFAYKMQMEVRGHQGKNAGADNESTADVIGKESGASGRTVQRYIRLTYLYAPLLELVDQKKLKLGDGVSLSYLTLNNQILLFSYYEENKKLPKGDQCEELRCIGEKEDISYEELAEIMEPTQKEENAMFSLNISALIIERFFDSSYEKKDVEKIILGLLQQWKEAQSM